MQADFRILDALTLSGDVTVQGIEYLYIIRKKPEGKASDAPKAGEAPKTGGEAPKSKPADPLEKRRARPGEHEHRLWRGR
ncbi:MAG: hypothetical protein QM813_05940 [Verrucomicrobiota bacterium]